MIGQSLTGEHDNANLTIQNWGEMDFQKLRKEYESSGIDDAEMVADPMDAFRHWFKTATDHCPANWFEPNAMTLATSDRTGNVTSRTVLLKGVDADSVRLYTNYQSTKGQQIADNPRASILFHWPYLGRQVRMRGRIEKTSHEDSLAYFHSRPRGAQIGALVSAQSSPIESRQWLVEQREKLESKFADCEVPLPETWGGYRLTPNWIEFWQGRSDRLHDRVVYTHADGRWSKGRVAP